MFDHVNYRDFLRDYSETILFTRPTGAGDGDWCPIRIISKTNEEGLPNNQVQCSHFIHGQIQINPWSKDNEFFVGYPESGFVNHNGRVALFQRTARRQWSKGISPNTARISYPTENGMISLRGSRAGTGQVNLSNLSLAHALYYRTFPNVEEAIRQLREMEALEVAVSTTHMLCQCQDEVNVETYMLWIKDKVVAKVELIDPTTTLVTLGNEYFRQEVQDFISRNGLVWTIKT